MFIYLYKHILYVYMCIYIYIYTHTHLYIYVYNRVEWQRRAKIVEAANDRNLGLMGRRGFTRETLCSPCGGWLVFTLGLTLTRRGSEDKRSTPNELSPHPRRSIHTAHSHPWFIRTISANDLSSHTRVVLFTPPIRGVDARLDGQRRSWGRTKATSII